MIVCSVTLVEATYVEYMYSCNLPATCTFGRMAGIVYVLLQ